MKTIVIITLAFLAATFQAKADTVQAGSLATLSPETLSETTLTGISHGDSIVTVILREHPARPLN